MRLPERKIAEIERAKAEAFCAARAIPADRLNWKPMGVGQSVLSMTRELAKTPDWALYVLTGAKPADPENAAEAQREELQSWRTVDECEAVCEAKLTALFDFYRSLTEDDLARTRWLPFNGGREHTYAEMLDYPRWNYTYHAGQIEYVHRLIDPKRGTCIEPPFR